jgi:hypothetical protein
MQEEENAFEANTLVDRALSRMPEDIPGSTRLCALPAAIESGFG